MSRTHLTYTKVVEISNDLNHLISVGTLHFHFLPTENLALQGCLADSSNYKWLDVEFLLECHKHSTHPVFNALVFLIRHRFFSATYRVFQLSVSSKIEPLAVCKVRVYAVPQDVAGSRYIKQWRSQWLAQFLARKFKNEWTVLLSVLDFSVGNWSGPSELNCSLWKFIKLGPLLLFPFSGTELHQDEFVRSSFFHFGRWLAQLPYYVPDMDIDEDSLDTVVKRIYNNVESPDLSKYKAQPGEYESSLVQRESQLPSPNDVIVSLVNNYPKSTIPGVTSELYPFQVDSLCKMLEKESFPGNIAVPYFKNFNSPTGSPYFFDMLNPGFYQNAELYSSPRGGILAENMGLGKTLICLSLVCLTKFEVSTVPSDIILFHDKSEYLDGSRYVSRTKEIKSLKEICRNVIAMNSLPWKYYQDDLPQSVVRLLSASPGYFKVSLENSHRASERRQEYLFRTLYLSNTTLLIVPENLFHQWNHELAKHIDPAFLHKLFVSDRFKKEIVSDHAKYTGRFPITPDDILRYDIVVVTSPALARLHKTSSENVLMSIYWKRLIIDEGHLMSLKNSNLSVLCSSISAERRWAVTGTPTSGLTNLHMDEEEKPSEDVANSPRKKRKYVVKSKFNVRDDLVKLGNLVGSYFKIEPFHSQPKLWNSAIVRNLTNSTFNTEKNLEKLLNLLMVRHNLSDVENDLKLPQLHHEAVFISPSYHNKLSVNLFAAVLAVNAVSSEREGSDYMFDPSNRQQLRRLVNNLQLATFYWTGFQHEDVQTLISIAKHCMEKKKPNGELHYGPQDQNLLKLSLSAAQEAVFNKRWRTASLLHEMQYFVRGLLPEFAKHFGIGNMESLTVFGAPQLASIQNFFYKNRFLDFNDLGKLNARLEVASKQFWESYWSDSARQTNTKFKRQESSHDFDVHGLKIALDEDVMDTQLTISPSKKNSSAQDWKSTRTSLEMESGTPGCESAFQDLKECEILGSASAKLSYLASRLVDHQKQKVKSIVFFEFEDSAYYLTELLDILGVNYILYATFIGAGQRSNNLADFDSHNANQNGGIALIMDLRLASHGLTIISATRVYFLSPVWQRSVEAQAIKRAHRIGQTNEVFVETLVLRGTLEEEIYRRRENDVETPANSRQFVIDDFGMQQFILRHDFLPTSDKKEYSEFQAASIDGESHTESVVDENPDSLLSHSSEVNAGQRKWTMRMFNPENLEKLNVLKRQKASIDELNTELVEGKPGRPETAKSVKKRKSVRF